MKKHKMEKDLLRDFFLHLRDNDFTITKKIVPKYYERINYKGDGERTIVNFSCLIEKSKYQRDRKRNQSFVLENFDI